MENRGNNPDGTFVLQNQLPNSAEIYKIDIQGLNKWIPYELEVPLNR
ncbi:MAG: hypothetical protein U9Q88_07715 [Bacillota bacterium]|nr:hypothetical protein [Bacillota bacterium]